MSAWLQARIFWPLPVVATDEGTANPLVAVSEGTEDEADEEAAEDGWGLGLEERDEDEDEDEDKIVALSVEVEEVEEVEEVDEVFEVLFWIVNWTGLGLGLTVVEVVGSVWWVVVGLGFAVVVLGGE